MNEFLINFKQVRLESPIVKTFCYDIGKLTTNQINYDVQIPLPEYVSERDLFGHLIAQHHFAFSYYKEVKLEFQKFVVNETQKFYDAVAERRLTKALKNQEELDISFILPQIKNDNFDQQSLNTNEENSLSFEDYFKLTMKKSTVKQLSQIVKEELEMSGKMSALVRARDFEMERLAKACETAMNNATLCVGRDANEGSFENDEIICQQSYNLAMLNEKLRQVSRNYFHQIEALRDSQKRAYRDFISKISNSDSEEAQPLLQKKLSVSSKHNQQQSSYGTRNMRKSFSCDLDSRGTVVLNQRDESFTIYIGAQMKSMHNSRILLCNQLSDLCLSNSTFGELNYEKTNISNFEQLFNSRRLQMLMSLYQRELTSVVLVVGIDPQFHIQNRTTFAKLCEQSAELHFDSLETQLKQIENEIRKANHSRRVRQNLQESSASFKQYVSQINAYGDENMLQPGDVYVTCHSNLFSAQVVFHLVTDNALETDDISSRHPCIIGLHNIIRLASRCAIQSISLPLLLVESMSETMTVSWCMARSELVFKCLKGFLMEVCTAGSTLSASAFFSVPGSTATTHYNINFALPSKISSSLFNQIVDLFSTIFHLGPSLSA